MTDKPDLEFFRDRPALDRLVNRTLFFLSNPRTISCGAVAMWGISVWHTSSILRAYLDHWIWSLAVIVVLILLVSTVIGVWLACSGRLIDGRPLYGKLGGPPAKLYRMVAKAQAHLQIELTEEGRELADDLRNLERSLVHDHLKQRYMKAMGSEPGRRFEDMWEPVWRKSQRIRIGGTTVETLLGDRYLAATWAESTAARAQFILGFFGSLFYSVMVIVVFYFLSDQLSLRVAIQVGASLSLILAALWMALAMYQLKELPITINRKLIDPEMVRTHDEMLRRLEGHDVVTAKNIDVDPEFFKRILGWSILRRIIMTVTTIGTLWLCLTIAFAWLYWLNPSYAWSTFAWHRDYGIAVAAIGVGLLMGFALFSLLLRNLTELSASIVAGLATAAIPYAVGYLRGEGDIGGAVNAVVAASGGISVTVATALTSLVKSKIAK